MVYVETTTKAQQTSNNKKEKQETQFTHNHTCMKERNNVHTQYRTWT